MNSPNLRRVNTLLFDLGGVFINLNPRLTTEAFARLAGRNPSDTAAYLKEITLFSRYETGQCTDAQFRQGVRELLRATVTDAQLDEAWNAMLLDIPPARIELLRRLRSRFRLLALSNTNPIHLEAVNRILHASNGVATLEDLFDRTYYSHQMGISKPAPESFGYVLAEEKTNAEGVLFLDDSADNIRAAQQMGFQTVHIQPPLTILELFGHV